VTISPVSVANSKSGAGFPSSTIEPLLRRAVGVVRVSRVGDREGERFVSPSEQRERIRSACERDGLELVDTLDEPNVSGGAPLSRRPGLRHAVELVEARQADVVVVAYFDRLVRSLQVQREVVERVEAAGGAIVALDVGEVRADTASRWLSSTMLGMVAEYHRRVTAERTAEAKRRALERGVPPFPNIPPGLRQRKDGRLEPNPKEAKFVRKAFELRASGATVMEVREYLRNHGIERSFHGVQTMLTSRIYLGELRFGELVNKNAHPPIVDAKTWSKVQRMRSPRGRRAKSERLLARLGVLRCGTCGSRMVVGTSNNSGYAMYRCPPIGDCPRRVTISADLAEEVVLDAVREAVKGFKGTASIADGLADAQLELEQCEAELDAAVRAFTGLDDVDAARERLANLRDARDDARTRVDELEDAAVPAVAVRGADIDTLTLDEQRALIRAVVDQAVVAPGRGRDRITVELRRE
jgi:DNA invertase Pin-like site-specific DNA recombinase